MFFKIEVSGPKGSASPWVLLDEAFGIVLGSLLALFWYLLELLSELLFGSFGSAQAPLGMEFEKVSF